MCVTITDKSSFKLSGHSFNVYSYALFFSHSFLLALQ